jgi:hypothetical protein
MKVHNNVVIVLFSIVNLIGAAVTIVTLGMLFVHPIDVKTMEKFFMEIK